MPNGFEGLDINKGGIQLVDPAFGFKGLEINTQKKLYLNPSFGFIGLEFNLREDAAQAFFKVEKK